MIAHLGHDENVGSHTAVFDREELASPTESTLDFVDDQKYTVLVADFSQALQVSGGRWNVTTFSEDGLDEDGGGVSGSGLLLQEKF